MSYTLTYFPIRGRVEHARLFLEDNKIPYKSQVVQFGDEWKSFKAKGLESGELPFGQVPVLHDGSLHLAQSGAIARHLARKHDKYGANELEKALNDMMFDMGIDIQNMYVKFIFDENHSQKKEEFVHEVKGKFDLVEKFIKRQGKPYLASSEPTFADYLMFEVCDVIKRQKQNNQQATRAKVVQRPRTAGEFLRRQFGEPHSIVNGELVYSVGGVIIRCSDKVLEESSWKLGSKVLDKLTQTWRSLLASSNQMNLVSRLGTAQNLKVRRDIRTLTKEERNELRDAFLKLKNEGNPLTGVTYDTFNRLHDADDMMLYGHMAPSFLPWHRYFVYLMELQLQNLTGNPNLTIPYWDFIEDSGLTSVFRADFMGGNGIGNSSTPAAKIAEAHGVADINSPVLDGPFAYHKGKWNCSEGPLVPFLRRDFGYTEFSPTLPDKSQLFQCMNLKIYDIYPFDSHSDKNISFRACVEGWASAYGEPDFLHNRVHAYIGGNMREIRSSSTDPVFYLVHANVDRIFASWQRINGIDKYEPTYRIDRGYMALDEYLRLLSPPRTVRQLLNYEDLGYTYDRFIELDT